MSGETSNFEPISHDESSDMVDEWTNTGSGDDLSASITYGNRVPRKSTEVQSQSHSQSQSKSQSQSQSVSQTEQTESKDDSRSFRHLSGGRKENDNVSSLSGATLLDETILDMFKKADGSVRITDSKRKRSMKMFNRTMTGSAIHDEVERQLKESIPSEPPQDPMNAYLYGCIHPDTQTSHVDVACHPACIGGFRPKNIPDCKNKVYSYKNGVLSEINDPKDNAGSGTVYIFSDTDNLSPLIRTLDELKIISYDIFYLAPGTLNAVWKVSKGNSNVKQEDPVVDNHVHDNSSHGGASWLWILILIIIVILIICLICYFVRRSKHAEMEAKKSQVQY